MPRNVKESDDEQETKGGRKTRTTLNPSVLDSPLRRSSRIKPPASQDASSPESTCDVSSVTATRNTRRRTTALENAVVEAPRYLRTRRNSAASDISELTETESLADSSNKRITRRSIASVTIVETPTKLRLSRRGTRAGSESKSTPPVTRVTRRTRASSMEPEITDEEKKKEVETPAKSRKRASALPSEPAVAEESEDVKNTDLRHNVEKTVYEENEDGSETPHNTPKSLRRKSKTPISDAHEKMEVDESPVVESASDTIEISIQENTEAAPDYSHVSKNLEGSTKITDSPEDDENSESIIKWQTISSLAKGSYHTVDNLLNKSIEKQEKSPGNKENEVFNKSTGLIEKNVILTSPEVRVSLRKSLNSEFKKTPENRHSINDETLLDSYELRSSSKNSEIIKDSRETFVRKEHLVDVDCVVVLETMRTDKIDAGKISDETSKSQSNQQIPNMYSQETEKEYLESQMDDVESQKDDNGDVKEFSTLKITNVMSIASESQKTREDSDDDDVQIIDDDIEPSKSFQPPMNKRNEMPASQIPSEASNLKEISTNRSSLSDEKISPKRSSLSPDEIMTRQSSLDTEENLTKRSSLSTEENSTKRSSLIAEENSTQRSSLNAEKIPTRRSSLSAAKIPTRRSSLSAEENATQLSSLSAEENAKHRSSLSAVENSTQLSSLNAVENSTQLSNFSAENIKKKRLSLDAEENSTKRSSCNVENVRTSSTEGLKKMAENQDIAVCEIAKDRKSSIVTESPTSGTNFVEPSEIIPDDNTDKCFSKGNLQDETDKDKKKNEERDELRVTDSENESESLSCPSFKDIPADEWTGEVNEETNGNNEGENNSVHSFSTEKNESECELVLVDKEPWLKERAERELRSLNYDSDDTVIAIIENTTKSGDDEKVEIESANEDIAMDLSSDMEDEDKRTSMSKKRASLNTKKLRNSLKMADNSGKDSSIGLNVSRRKSLINVEDPKPMDDESNEGWANSEATTSIRSRKSLKNRNSAQGQVDSSDNEHEEVKKTPKSVSRKSSSSAKKSNSTPDASTENISLTSSLKKKNDSAVKCKSLNKSLFNGRDEDDLELGLSESLIDETNMAAAELKISAKAEEKSRLSLNESKAESLDTSKNSSLRSLEVDENILPKSPRDREIRVDKLALSYSARNSLNTSNNVDEVNVQQLNKSEKLGSARKSLNKNSSKIALEASNSEDEEDSQPKLDKSGSTRKSLNVNRSNINEANSESEMNVDDSEVDPVSPKIQEEKLKESASARKSMSNRSSSQIAQENSDPEDEYEDLREKLNKSAKLRRASVSKIDVEDSEDELASPQYEKLNKSTKSESARKSTSNKNISQIVLENSELEDDLHQKLNESVKSGCGKKSLNETNSNSGSDLEEDDSQPKIDKTSKSGSAKKTMNKSVKSSSTRKSKIDENYSIVAQANSDSEVDENVELESNDDEADLSRKVPRFLFDVNTSSNSDDDSSKSIDSDIANEMNLHGKSIVKYSDDDVPADNCMETESESSDSDDGADLGDFIVGEEEEEEEEEGDEEEEEEEKEGEGDSFEDDLSDQNSNSDELHESPSTEKPRKRIISRPADDSDSLETDEVNSHSPKISLDKSKIAKTPKKMENLNKPMEIVEPVSKSSMKIKDTLIQSSTPKLPASDRLLSEQVNSAKSSKSTTIERTSAKKLSKLLAAEMNDTPKKHGSSFKEVKTPEASTNDELPLRASLPTDLKVSGDKTNLSKEKSTNVTALHHTMTTPNTDSPETRFLMKEKLNDTLPALKLQQRVKSSRRSVLNNLHEEVEAKEEDDNENEKTSTGDASAQAEIIPEVSSVEKKKKKKKKKKKEASSKASEDMKAEISSVLENLKERQTDECVECLQTEESTKKSKKRNRNKTAESQVPIDMETEGPMEIEEIPRKKKNKKKKLEEVIVEEVQAETKKKDKKKKKIEEVIIEEVQTETKKKDKKKKKIEEVIVEEVEADMKKKDKKKKKIEEVIVEEVEAEMKKKDKKKKKKKTQNGDFEESVENLPVDGDDAPEAIGFSQARKAALDELKNVTESIIAGKAAMKNKLRADKPNLKEGRKKKGADEKSKTSIKRLPDDILENLSDVAERPKKRRKIVREEKIPPSRTMLNPYHQSPTSNSPVRDFMPLSTSGSTTQFTIVNLKKTAKKSKKSVAVETFRERMLARNSRQPVSAYLMYRQKQKASGKDRPY